MTSVFHLNHLYHVPTLSQTTTKTCLLLQVAGGQDLESAAESPLLTGRVVAQLAAEAKGKG
jgi:hypothetical protein